MSTLTDAERYALLMASLPEAVVILAPDGTVVALNRAAERLYGWTSEELAGQSLDTFLPDALKPLAKSRFDLIRTMREPRVVASTHRDRAGATFEVQITTGAHFDAAGVLKGATAIVRRRSEAEADPRHHDRMVQLAAQSLISLGSFEAVFTQDGSSIHWSPELYEMFGLPLGSPIDDSTLQRLIYADDRAKVVAVRNQALKQGGAFEQEYRIARANDAQVRWVQIFATAVHDGPRTRLTGVLLDVTDRRNAMSELAASEERLRRILDSTSDGMLIRTLEGTITFTNRRLEELFGYGQGEMLGLEVGSLSAETQPAGLQAQLEARRRGEANEQENEFRRRDGSVFWARVRGEPLRDDKGEVIGGLGTFTDLTFERRARGAESHLAAIVESSHDAIYSRSLDGRFLSFNRAAEQLTGYSASEVIGKHVSLLSPAPETIDPLVNRANRDPAHLELPIRKKDGTVIEVHITGFPLVDARGAVTGVSAIFRDLSEQRRKDKELKRMEEQLHAAQKLEAIGSLAGGIAHDFNNILTVILTNSTLAAESLPEASLARADIDEIRLAAERATQLVRQLLAFSRKQVLRPRPVELSQLLHQLAPMLNRLLGEQVELSLLSPRALPKVMADPAQMEQVVLNLCVNARDAMPKGGKLTLELSQMRLDEHFSAGHLGSTPGNHVMLAVSDTGVGMSPEVKARIFEPFFSTKGEMGTGLGLSTVFGIVKQSGGNIYVYSEPGKGTSFKVYLPVTDNEATAAREDEVRPATGGGETVLLVEDEPQVRTLVRGVLRKGGYTVLEAASPGDALLVVEQYQANIHLLLTDVVMPRMNGRELAQRLVEKRPAMKVLFMSGYTSDAIVQHGVLDGALEFLEKPLTPDALLRKVRAVLDR